jgi:hypothetical protein
VTAVFEFSTEKRPFSVKITDSFLKKIVFTNGSFILGRIHKRPFKSRLEKAHRSTKAQNRTIKNIKSPKTHIYILGIFFSNTQNTPRAPLPNRTRSVISTSRCLSFPNQIGYNPTTKMEEKG